MNRPEPSCNRDTLTSHRLADDALFTSCVHCGFCLEVCPTYRLTGDENNSPRGRLRLWREEASGKLPQDPWTVFYTSECVGCMACETACPANVPYGELLEQIRHEQVRAARIRPPLRLRVAAKLASHPRWMDLAFLPARWFRGMGWLKHQAVFPGKPPVLESSARYAQRLMRIHQPQGPRVALLTGCLMESLFREINHATIRVLIDHGVQVVIPDQQTCCGAFQEHLGLEGTESLRERNRNAFRACDVDAIVSNSSGCGRALAKSLSASAGNAPPVEDVLQFLARLPLKRRTPKSPSARVYVDQPCHLVHGQKTGGIPPEVLDATGYPWEWAPDCRDCCGSGGTYQFDKPENARAILVRKSDFLRTADGDPVILATSNHVCMMQWYSAGPLGVVSRPYLVQHVIQLLDPNHEPEVPCRPREG